MEKTAKIFNLSVEEIGIIKEVQETYGYKQQVQALRHILMAYKKMESEEEKYKKVAGEVLKEFENKYGESWKRLYMSVRQTDKKNTIMQDAINTMLIENAYEHNMPVDVVESPVLEEARKHLQGKIQKKKQQADKRKRLKNATRK